MLKQSFPNVTIICTYLFQIKNVRLIYIWPKNTKHNWTLYTRTTYVHVVKKLFVVNVHKLHWIFSNDIDIKTYIQNQNINFFHLLLNLGINIWNLIYPIWIEQCQSINTLKFQKVLQRNEFNRERNTYTTGCNNFYCGHYSHCGKLPAYSSISIYTSCIFNTEKQW